MQITSNTYSNCNQTSTVPKIEAVSKTSFAFMLSTTEDKVTEKSEGVYLKHIEQYNIFDSLTEETRKAFKEILKDDEITMSEMDSLSYEQTKLFKDCVFPVGLSKDELGKVPLTSMPNKAGDMMFASRLTNDDTLNESLYRTAREVDDDHFRLSIFSNLSQAISIALTDPESEVFLQQWEWDESKIDLDYSELLENERDSLHEDIKKAIARNDFDYAKQLQMDLDGYNIVSKHCSEILDENIQ